MRIPDHILMILHGVFIVICGIFMILCGIFMTLQGIFMILCGIFIILCGILITLVFNGSLNPGGSALQIVHPRILDKSGAGVNLTMIPTVTNMGGEKFDIVRYDLPCDENDWTKVIPP